MKHLGIIVLAACLVAGCNTTRTPPPTSSSLHTTIVVTLAADQTIRVNGQSVEPTALATTLNSSGHPKDSPVLIRVDKTARHRDFVQILDQLKKAGFANVSAVTQ
ncbi:MAG: biopolymer transporter ExbD [Lentisphaeria bacterium]|jgi:biopolymer transport protein ExbD|nr:biopolymer transporter ExbD [Lentisphaeria bacterium]